MIIFGHLLTLFTAAFIDNFFKSFAVMQLLSGEQSWANLAPALLGALFIIPFLCFSFFGQRLLESRGLRWVLLCCKLLELIAGLSLMAWQLPLGFNQSQWWLASLGMLALGIHSAVYGPFKYALLPQITPKEKLLHLTAWVEGLTFLAIILGVYLGTWLGGHQRVALSYSIIIFFISSLLGAVGMMALWPMKFTQSQKAIPGIRNQLKEQPGLILIIQGISLVFFIGSFFINLFPLLTLRHWKLPADSSTVQSFFLLMSVGMALGSVVVKWWVRASQARDYGVFLCMILFVHLILWSMSIGLEVSWVDWGMVLLLGVILGAMSTLFYLLLQQSSGSQSITLPQLVAYTNIHNALAILLAAGILMLTQLLNFSVPVSLFIVSWSCLIVPFFAFRWHPAYFFRALLVPLRNLCYRVTLYQGGRSIDQLEVSSQGLIYACNHLTFIDWLFVPEVINPEKTIAVVWYRYFRFPLTLFLKPVGIIPIANRSEDPQLYSSALERVKNQLEQGKSLILFPEGEILRPEVVGHHDLAPLKKGIWYWATFSQVKVQPLWIGGLRDSIWGRSPHRWQNLWKRWCSFPWHRPEVRLRLDHHLLEFHSSLEYQQQDLEALKSRFIALAEEDR